MRSSTPSCQSPPHRMAPLPTSKKTSLLTARLRPIWALPSVMERMARLPVSRKDTSWVPAKTTSASDTNARLSRLVAADHSQAHEHGWTELLTISLGRHAEFARSSRTITSTTSATNRAGRSGQSLHVCAPLFEGPTVSISHPTERPPETTVDPPHTTPLRPLKWAQSRCTSPPSRLPVPIGELTTVSAVHEPGSRTVADSGAPAEHQGCGQLDTLPRQTGRVSSLSHVLVCAPPRTAPHVNHALPHKLDLEINRRRYAPRTVGKSRACQVVPTTPGQGSSERGG